MVGRGQMETKANFFLIGLFTIVSLALAVIFTVWIANAGLDKQYASYDVLFDGPVRGVEIGGDVRFNGIKVGEVNRLSLDKTNPSKVVARIRVVSETPVKADSVAQLEPAGLTGLAYIQILAGSPKAGPLIRQKGQERPVIVSRGSQIDRLFQGSEGVLSTTLETLARVNRLLDDKNLAAVSNAINNSSRLISHSSDAALAIQQAGIGVGNASKSLESLSANFGTTSATYNQLGLNLIEQTKGISDKSNLLLESSNTAANSVSKLSSSALATLNEIDETSRTLRNATEDFRKSAVNFSDASITTNKFFENANNDTLPAMNTAANNLAITAESIDTLVRDANNSPTGLLSRAPSQTVKWKN